MKPSVAGSQGTRGESGDLVTERPVQVGGSNAPLQPCQVSDFPKSCVSIVAALSWLASSEVRGSGTPPSPGHEISRESLFLLYLRETRRESSRTLLTGAKLMRSLFRRLILMDSSAFPTPTFLASACCRLSAASSRDTRHSCASSSSILFTIGRVLVSFVREVN